MMIEEPVKEKKKKKHLKMGRRRETERKEKHDKNTY